MEMYWLYCVVICGCSECFCTWLSRNSNIIVAHKLTEVVFVSVQVLLIIFVWETSVWKDKQDSTFFPFATSSSYVHLI